jgi:hypothetical protein
VSLLGKQRAYWGKYPSSYIVKNALNPDLVYYVLKHLHGLCQSCQGRREGGKGEGANCPGRRGVGGPWKFFVGPQSFLRVKYFRAKEQDIWFFGAKYLNLAWKIEIKSLENNCKLRKKIFRKKILNRGPPKKFDPGSRQPLGGPECCNSRATYI